MEKTIVIPVIIMLFLREFQKFVTLIASAKLPKLKLLGKLRAPKISFVISDGDLKAIIMVMYRGNKIVTQPKISNIVRLILDFPTLPF